MRMKYNLKELKCACGQDLTKDLILISDGIYCENCLMDYLNIKEELKR